MHSALEVIDHSSLWPVYQLASYKAAVHSTHHQMKVCNSKNESNRIRYADLMMCSASISNSVPRPLHINIWKMWRNSDTDVTYRVKFICFSKFPLYVSQSRAGRKVTSKGLEGGPWKDAEYIQSLSLSMRSFSRTKT